MRLKRLTLHGYKTFASRTSFEFGNGITAVVGPNGSGKSNIADAIRWVLGEQSYSTLRGKKTTDMIFAGSQKRPRAGMAQAILTLDNTEGWLPIEYSEIEVCRRAYRSGENEYLLNGNKVRLRDVSELLATSGLARRTYTIIGQGLVDQALSLRADERRMLFEEAAGISQYKSKRAETFRRLQETDHNLERLHDIVSEIKPRLTSLRRQAKRASNYEQVAADLRYHLRIWYGYRWVQARNDLREFRLVSRNARGLWEKSRKKQLGLQQELKTKREHVIEVSEALQHLEAEREKQRDQLEVIRRNVAVLMEREKEFQRQEIEIAEEMPGLQKQQEKARQEVDTSIVELNLARETVESEQEKLERIDLETKTQRQKIASYEDRVGRLQKEMRHSLDRLATTKGRLDQQRFQLGELEETKLDKSRLAEAQQDLQESLDSLASTAAIVAKLEEDRNNGLRRLELLGNKLFQLETTVSGIQSEIIEARELVSALVVRRDLLGQMRVNDSSLPEKFTNAPRLFDQIRIPSEYRVAIEAALGYQLEALVFQEDSVLWEFENEPEKRLILLIANRMSPQEPQKAPNNRGVIGWASDLVTSPDNTDAFYSVLSSVLIVENKSDALNLGMQVRPSTLVVSLDGLVVHPSGLVEIGSIGAKDSVLAREEEWLSSNQELASLAERQHILQRKLEATLNNLSLLNLDREKLQETDSNLLTQIEENRNNLADLQRDADRIQHKLELIQEKQSLRAKQSQKLAASIAAEEKAVTSLEKESLDSQSEFEKSKEILDALPTFRITEQRNQQIQQVDSARTILAGRQAVVDSRRATMNQIDELLTRRNERKLDIQDRLQKLDLEENQTNLQAIEQNSETIGKKLIPLVKELATQRQELSKLEIAADNIQSQGHELETRFSQSRIELGQAENVLESLKERISAELGVVTLSYDDNQPEQSPLPMDDIVEHLPEIKELPEDIEETIHRYRGQLTRMGGINPEAPAEYETTTQRYEHLRNQIEDLIDTQEKLRGVIEELDDKTSQAFAATVKKVDEVFGDVFKRLFGGGSAKLILTDPDNLVDSGVEIIARLPRRREQGLALLSGGERSLTATALVFALLKVSPTPFCVLDEVDAMLDEANINRFRDLLQELSQQTQFILITHNRGTIQVAESVYGVSMGSDSVSQVISIKPEDYLVGAPAAAQPTN